VRIGVDSSAVRGAAWLSPLYTKEQ